MRRLWLAGAAMAAAAVASAAQADDFDARHPADVAKVIAAHGANGALKRGDGGKDVFEGQVGELFFEIHFQDCDAGRTLCQTMVFSGSWSSKELGADLLNRWNRWALYCPAFGDTDATPVIWYPVAVSAHTAPEDIAADLGVWMNCLKDFDSFVSGPDDFLRRNGEQPPPAQRPH